jgi:hypothetical protein
LRKARPKLWSAGIHHDSRFTRAKRYRYFEETPAGAGKAHKASCKDEDAFGTENFFLGAISLKVTRTSMES